MARPRKPGRDRVFELADAHPAWSSEQIHRRLQRELVEAGCNPSDVPSPRWVRGVLAEWGKMDLDQRRPYMGVHWPESFGITDELPWEAAPVVLELLRVTASEERRPTVRLAKWFWRVTLAWPEDDAQDRLEIARQLALAEGMGMGTAHAAQTFRTSERILAFRVPRPADGTDRTVIMLGATPEEAGWTPGAGDMPFVVSASSERDETLDSAQKEGLLDKPTAQWIREGRGESGNEG